MGCPMTLRMVNQVTSVSTAALPQHGLVFTLCDTSMLLFFHHQTLCSAALTLSLPTVPGKISDRDSTFPREEEN